MNPGTTRPAAAAAVGLGAITAVHGTIGLIAAAVTAGSACSAIVLCAAVHEWYRLRALREPGRQMQWLITHAPSSQEAKEMAALLFAAHAATMSALAGQPADAEAQVLPSGPGDAVASPTGPHAGRPHHDELTRATHKSTQGSTNFVT